MFADPFSSFSLISCLPGPQLEDTHGGCRQIGKSATSEISCAAVDLIADPHVGKRRTIGKHRVLRSSSRCGSTFHRSAANQ